MASKVINIIVISLGVLAFIMCAASCGGDKWLVGKGRYEGRHSGLWVVCNPNSPCKSFDELAEDIGGKVADYLNQVRGFSILSCLALLTGVIFAVISLVRENVKILIAGILYGASALSMLIAMGIYTNKVD